MQALQGFAAFISPDYIILFVTWVVFAFMLLRSMGSLVVAVVLAIPSALLAYAQMSEAAWLSGVLSPESASSPIIFGVLMAVIAFAIHRMAYSLMDDGQPMQAAIGSLSAIAFVLAVWSLIPQANTLWDWNGYIDAIFAPAYAFWWIIGSLLALGIFRR